MRIRVYALVLAVILVCTPAFATNWTRIVPVMRVATVSIQCSLHQRITCTAFSIDTARGHYLTTAHCLHPGRPGPGEEENTEDHPLIDGFELEILFEDTDLDLAVVRISTQRPALKIQTKRLQQGMEVGAFGYALGRPVPSFRTAFVSRFDATSDNMPFVAYDNALVRGMSGGPIVDASGRVVGVSTRSDAESGYSLTPQYIYLHTQEFWGKQ